MTILSTKRLLSNQRELLLNAGVRFVEYNAISIARVPFTLSRKRTNIIITSQNGAQIFIDSLKHHPIELGQEFEKYFVVGSKTTALLTEEGIKVTKTAQNASELAHYIAQEYPREIFTYICGKQRRDELPNILKEAGIFCNEVVVYQTYESEQSFDRTFDAVLFFSPSGVSAFAKANLTQPVAFCIGETTAKTARKYFDQVIVSNATTIESTIAKAVKYLANGL